MKPRDPRIVELLNETLAFELSITNTYFLHGRMLDSWGFPRLGKVFYDLSIDEMKDADSLIQRVLMFEGHPNVQRLRPISIGEDAEEMLPWPWSRRSRPWPCSMHPQRSAARLATTARPRSSTRWSWTRSRTVTGSRRSCRPSRP